MFRIVLALSTLALSGCASGSSVSAGLPNGQAAYSALAASPEQERAQDYRIGALDEVSVSVFQEPDLSLKEVQVDASGNIAFPLIGKVPAAGKTAAELSSFIGEKLGERYLRNPQVTVSVLGSVSQKVVVQGEVTQAGVYEIKGRTSLLEALSMAKGETRVASLKEVVVFRNIEGRRMGAVFDVAAIRRGQAEDPAILGNDVVVVGASHAKTFWREVRESSGLASVFSVFRPY